MAKLEQRAYFAGLFDGEGYVGCTSIDKVHKTIRAVIANKDNTPLEILKAEYGGCVYYGKSAGCWFWEIKAKKAIKFYEDIVEFSIIKKERIELVLAERENIGYAKISSRVKLMDRLNNKLKSLNDPMGYGRTQ